MSDVTDLKAEVLLLRRENKELRDEIEHVLIKRQHTEDENAKLKELAARMARALGVGRWCSADCGREFGCDWTPEGCPVANAMRELGVDE